jgi:predicted RNA binding protein YcfA (HicA-like mRNA interferase family)
VTYRQLTRKLRRLGCEFDRQARGDHEVWINPATGGRTTIQNWGGRDLPPGTLRAILRDLSIELGDLQNA